MSDVKKKKKIHLLTGCRGQNRLVSRNKIQLLTWYSDFKWVREL